MGEQAAGGGASFSIGDWLVVLFYMVSVVAIGLWAGRGQKDKRDYFLGGRNLSWWLVGLSIVASETSALTIIGVPAMAIGALKYTDSGGLTIVGGNMTFMMLMVGHVIGRCLVAKLIIPHYFRGDVYTPYQLLTRAFGQSARSTAGFLSLIGMCLGQGVRIFVTAIPVTIVMQTSFPWWQIWMSIFAILIGASIYTAIGGVKAVIWTDMIQYFIYLAGGLFALFYIPMLLKGPLAAPSGAEGWGAIGEVAGGNGVLKWFDLGTDTPFTGYNLLMGLLPMTFNILFALGFDQLTAQRVLTCKDATDGRKAMLLSASLVVPQFLMFLLIGAGLYTYYTLNGGHFGSIPPVNPSILDELGRPKPSPDFIFPVFIVNHVPFLLKGFLLAAILAAATSVVSSGLSAMSSIAVMDLYKPFRNSETTDKEELWLSRVVTVLAAVALAAVAFACQQATLIFNLAFRLAGLTSGGVLGAFIYGLVRKKGHPIPPVLGMLGAFAFMALFNVGMEYKWIPTVNWPWHTLMGTVVCLLVIAATRPLFKDQGTGKGIDVVE